MPPGEVSTVATDVLTITDICARSAGKLTASRIRQLVRTGKLRRAPGSTVNRWLFDAADVERVLADLADARPRGAVLPAAKIC
jgi:hypothetical protein